LSLREFISDPFVLLLEIERRAKAAIASRQGDDASTEEWIGVAFRLASEQFVAARADVREVLPVPDQITRIPGAKPWLRGIANVRGQLLTIVDLKAFLGAGSMQADRKARMLVLSSREVPSAIIVDEVLGFRRFDPNDFNDSLPQLEIRCEHYLGGQYLSDGENYPLFNLWRLLEDPGFLNAGQLKTG
jgi:twitching motility protein PilI